MRSTTPDILDIRDKVLDLSSPKIMGILNATPDSFADGGKYNALDSALGRIGLMVSQGATIIDVGGESTRPGSDPVTEDEELQRVIPVLKEAISRFPDTLFSIDTTKYRVAEEALKLGVHLVNDISGLQKEPRFAELCLRYSAGYILMHSQGNPKTMQDDPSYDEVVDDIKTFFTRQLEKAKEAGLKQIILDPGIGFGKTQRHNISILKRLPEFVDLGYPLLVGASRKSMIGRILGDREVDDRVTGTVAVHYHAMMQGAKIIRVHDVKEANDSILVYNELSGD
ncbi:MAG: dihydropteroate synthase [Balneolaceae bacterium]|nr:dihydropteroate synthase [Balneolaceae bacterium]